MALRYNEKTTITAHFPAQIPSIQLAPLLFISIVENAFKHGISATEPSYVYFELQLQDQSITFISKNSNFVKNQSDYSGSGIGLENLKKRLELLYPNQYNFHTEANANEYQSTLTIQVKQNTHEKN